jgi:2-polyprenyl-6-hydroxyphenyl methylase/3-demethylubiquinone-9 3-methyltransferase
MVDRPPGNEEFAPSDTWFIGDGFPSPKLYAEVCRRGFSVIRPLIWNPDPALDAYGWNYGAARPPSYAAYGRLRALLALGESAGLRPRRALEVAAGDASLSACLQQTGCEVTANDLREDDLKQAVANFRNGARIRVLPGNVFDLDPAETGCFDLVIACEIIEHVAHPIEFLLHLKKFLTPGGHVLLTTPNGAYFRSKLRTYSQVENFTALESEQFKPDADGHLFLFTPAELRQAASQAGFNVDRLFVWGTPFISGESGFRVLSGILPMNVAYFLERFSQRLSTGIRHRIANSISAILSPAA